MINSCEGGYRMSGGGRGVIPSGRGSSLCQRCVCLSRAFESVERRVHTVRKNEVESCCFCSISWSWTEYISLYILQVPLMLANYGSSSLLLSWRRRSRIDYVLTRGKLSSQEGKQELFHVVHTSTQRISIAPVSEESLWRGRLCSELDYLSMSTRKFNYIEINTDPHNLA